MHAGEQDASDERGVKRPRQDDSLPPARRQRLDDKVGDKRDFFFPHMPVGVRAQLMLDDVANFSVTDHRSAEKISQILVQHAPHARTITDATACVGGNVFSFAAHFQHVQAVELDKQRFDFLEHNVRILQLSNVQCVHGDFVKLGGGMSQDIVFMDPPWGGPEYKDAVALDLRLSGVDMSQVCDMVAHRASLIALKLPTNFNVTGLRERMKYCTVVREERGLRKMLLLLLATCQWRVRKSATSGRPYFFNIVTEASQYEEPPGLSAYLLGQARQIEQETLHEKERGRARASAGVASLGAGVASHGAGVAGQGTDRAVGGATAPRVGITAARAAAPSSGIDSEVPPVQGRVGASDAGSEGAGADLASVVASASAAGIATASVAPAAPVAMEVTAPVTVEATAPPTEMATAPAASAAPAAPVAPVAVEATAPPAAPAAEAVGSSQ